MEAVVFDDFHRIVYLQGTVPVRGIIDTVSTDYELGALPVEIQPGPVECGGSKGELRQWKLVALVQPPFTQDIVVAPMPVSEQQCLSKMVVCGVDIQQVVSIGIDNPQIEKPVGFLQGQRVFDEPIG